MLNFLAEIRKKGLTLKSDVLRNGRKIYVIHNDDKENCYFYLLKFYNC